MTDTRMEFWHRRGRELHHMTKADLCTLYRRLGALDAAHPLESWTKDELTTAIAEAEWNAQQRKAAPRDTR